MIAGVAMTVVAWTLIPGVPGPAAMVSSVVSHAFGSPTSSMQPHDGRSASGAGSRAWASCGPVPFLVSTGSADPELSTTLILEAREAFARISALTGVTYVYAGVSTDHPASSWAVSPVRVAGYQHVPVLIGWVPVTGTDLLAENQWAATSRFSDRATGVVSGVVALNEDQMSGLDSGFESGASRGVVLLHELGHLSGLDHAESGLMSPVVEPGGPTGFTPAEQAMLASASPACSRS